MGVIIKAFQTPNGKYVYDRETNSILSLNDSEYQAFSRISGNEENEKDILVLKLFQEKGYCKESKLKYVEHPHSGFLEAHLLYKISKATLQITQNCNLRCSYCIYSGAYRQRTHRNKVMSLQTIRKSIDFLIQHSSMVKTVNLGFYGGEPLLEYERIKSAVNYVKKRYPNKEMTFSLTTNGTLFSESIIDFLAEHNFSVLISIDGPKEIHDSNRVFEDKKGSFDVIMDNLARIKKRNPGFYKSVGFSAVIAPKSEYKCIDDFFNASDFIKDNLISSTTVSTFFTDEDIPYEEQYYISYNIERTKMLLAALKYIDKKSVSKLLSDEMTRIKRFYKELSSKNGLPEKAHPGGPCIPGAMRAMIDVDGYIYPCERISESSEIYRIGHIDRGFDIQKTDVLLNAGRLSENECINCWNFIHCGMCAVAADSSKGFSKEARLKFCDIAMARTMSTFETICFLKENDYDFEDGFQ